MEEEEGISIQQFSPEAVARVGQVLADEATPLAERFRAVFTLRNVATRQALDALMGAMGSDSALLKHEIAYCLGQVGDSYSVPFLSKVLSDPQENTMVRHEAGEALG